MSFFDSLLYLLPPWVARMQPMISLSSHGMKSLIGLGGVQEPGEYPRLQ